MSQFGRRLKKIKAIEKRLVEDGERLRAQAKMLKSGARREALLQKAQQAETTARVSEWLRIPTRSSVRH
jgi:hypothetical protein